MSNENTTSLLPCPFCGKPAQMKTAPHVPEGTDYTPQCTNSRCIGRLSKKYTSKEKAIREWNNRWYPQPVESPVEETTNKPEKPRVPKAMANYWKCKHCGSLHRNEGGTHRDKEGRICCDTCGTPIFEVNAEKVK